MAFVAWSCAVRGDSELVRVTNAMSNHRPLPLIVNKYFQGIYGNAQALQIGILRPE